MLYIYPNTDSRKAHLNLIDFLQFFIPQKFYKPINLFFINNNYKREREREREKSSVYFKFIFTVEIL